MIWLTTLLQWRPWHAPGDHMGWGGWTMMFFFWLVVIGVIVWLVATLGQRAGSDDGHRSRSGEDRAESVLRERYARGEIDEGTYQRMLDELRRS